MSNYSANITCGPPTAVPDTHSLPIKGIYYAIIQGNNISDPYMGSCCSPNPVNIINNCYEWCEFPKQYTNGSSLQNALSNFQECLHTQGKTGNYIVGSNTSAAPWTKKISVEKVAVIALVVASLLL